MENTTMETMDISEAAHPAAALCIRDFEKKGRGVVALRSYEPGETIETAPVIVIPSAQWPALEGTVLYDYGFAYGPELEDMAIVLGFGSLYNHSYEPNAKYVRYTEERLIEFLAIRPIQPGEEITVNYNCDPNDRSPLWFPCDEPE